MEPRRLGQCRRAAFERTLLASAMDDRPSPEARKALAALALGAAGSTATGVARHGLASFAGGKGVVLLGLVALGAGVLWWVPRSQAPASPVVLAPRATVAVPVLPVPTAEAHATSTEPSPPGPSAPPVYAVQDLPVAVPAKTTHAAETAGGAPPAAAVSDLAAERSLVERARAALAGDDARTALTALDEYDRRFPRGLLRDEADVMRIDAFTKSGRLPLARSLAKAFLATRGDGPYAVRVRSFLESTE